LYEPFIGKFISRKCYFKLFQTNRRWGFKTIQISLQRRWNKKKAEIWRLSS
jgi:hypothetical protein